MRFCGNVGGDIHGVIPWILSDFVVQQGGVEDIPVIPVVIADERGKLVHIQIPAAKRGVFKDTVGQQGGVEGELDLFGYVHGVMHAAHGAVRAIVDQVLAQFFSLRFQRVNSGPDLA